MAILLGLREACDLAEKLGFAPGIWLKTWDFVWDLAETLRFFLGLAEQRVFPSFASPTYFWHLELLQGPALSPVLLQSPNWGTSPLGPPLTHSLALGRAWILPNIPPAKLQWGPPCIPPTPQDIPQQLQRFHGAQGLRMLLDALGLGGSPTPPGVALALVGGDVVPLFKPLPADIARELVEGVGVVFPHVPVQGGFLAAREAADLTPGE